MGRTGGRLPAVMESDSRTRGPATLAGAEKPNGCRPAITRYGRLWRVFGAIPCACVQGKATLNDCVTR